MKKRYIELMNKVLDAYSERDVREYFERVSFEGLTEHGFPRLTACIGILIARGFKKELLPLFSDMMELCCRQIPRVKAANDFSVREIVCCLYELEAARAVPEMDIERWRGYISEIVAEDCYTVYAEDEDSSAGNWALFSGVSEYFRLRYFGLPCSEFVEVQLGSQLKRFDELGMYMDYGDIHNPTTYDAVARMLFSLVIKAGYRGRHYERISELLRLGGICSLKMQSALGELPFGGRSNQFLHNEACMASIFEFEASRCRAEGNIGLAEKYDGARAKAIKNIEENLSLDPILHIKNRFPKEKKFGCEGYAYFDKYMITAASFLFAAYTLCDGCGKTQAEYRLEKADTFVTTYHFHKAFLSAGEYSAELELNGDEKYDCGGLGRLCREGAPSVIAINCPCPRLPKYRVNLTEPSSLSVCVGVRSGEKWCFATEKEHKVIRTESRNNYSSAELSCNAGETEILSKYELSGDGLSLTVKADGAALLLPAFFFDGERYSDISLEEGALRVSFDGWKCVYKTDGKICELGWLGANRNGNYKAYAAYTDGDVLRVSAKIEKIT